MERIKLDEPTPPHMGYFQPKFADGRKTLDLCCKNSCTHGYGQLHLSYYVNKKKK